MNGRPLTTPDYTLIAIGLLAAGGLILGAGELFTPLEKLRRWGGFARLVSLLFLAGSAAAAALFGLPSTIWLVLAVLAGVIALQQTLRSPWTLASVSWAFRQAARPRLQAAAVLTGCLGAAFWWANVAEQSMLPPDEVDLSRDLAVHPRLADVVGVEAWTDRGTRVPLSRAVDGSAGGDRALSVSESGTIDPFSRDLRVLRTGLPEIISNCHGWTFASGRFWVPPASVKQILEDNGYRVVTAPRPQDLVIYWDAAGIGTHSGVVRAGGDGGPTLVESKWGSVGRFVHPPEAQPYSPNFTFHRSPRVGHQLRMREVAPRRAPGGAVAIRLDPHAA